MKITKLEHSCVLIQSHGSRLLIDPGSLTAPTTIADLGELDAVLVTHRHGDHFDADILKKVGAPIFGPAEVVALARTSGLSGCAVNVGEASQIGAFLVTAVAADHGPAVTKPVENLGYIIECRGKSIYITGDVFGPQPAAPRGPFGAVVLPIEGGGFVFDPAEASTFLRKIGHTRVAVPCHTDDLAGLGAEFVKQANSFCIPCVLNVKESTEI
jgi:L-ascorbate metabolism protein UlaG (beta-lactamase superfamily)